MAHALNCPKCGASECSPPDANGLAVCSYCGAQIRVHEASPPAASSASGPPPAPGGSGAGVIVAVAALVVAGAALALFATGGAPATPQRPLVERPGGWRLDLSSPPAPATSATPTSATVGETAPAPVAARAEPVELRAPPPKPAPTGTFEQHSVARLSTGASFYLLGFVTNTSPYPVQRPRVHVVLLDEEGHEVGAEAGFAVGDVLGAGERSPAAILVSDPPTHAALRCEVELREATWAPEPAADLRLEPLPAQETRFGWSFSGAVTNDGDAPARFVQVLIAAYDDQDRLVGLTQCYAAAQEGLAPGRTGRYRASHSAFARRPARFEVTVRGRR